MRAWFETTLGEVCIGIFDGPHATPKKTQSGPLFLGISSLANGRLLLSDTEHLSEADFTKWTRRVAPQPDDVVFSYETRLGEAALIPEGLRCCLGRRLALMRPDKTKIEPRFLLYYYLSPTFKDFLRSRTNPGSTVDRILLTEVPSYPILLPPLEEQHAIAGILGALDDKIELNRQMNRTLEAMARAIFTSWFVDFDPVTAKAASRQPVRMDTETAALFPDHFADSDLGPIPAGWLLTTIGEEVSVVGGSTPSSKEPRFWSRGTINWITPRDLARLSDPVVLDTERRITPEGLAQISSGLLPCGTVLLSSRAPIGYLAIAETPLAVNQGFIAMVCDKVLPNHYVRLWTQANLDEILARAGGTTFPEISKASFRPIPILVPSRDVLQAFMRKAEPLYQQLVANVRECSTLAALRNALLPKLLSGEIRVRDAEKAAEQALA